LQCGAKSGLVGSPVRSWNSEIYALEMRHAWKGMNVTEQFQA
jgi:hypothetical protein